MHKFTELLKQDSFRSMLDFICVIKCMEIYSISRCNPMCLLKMPYVHINNTHYSLFEMFMFQTQMAYTVLQTPIFSKSLSDTCLTHRLSQIITCKTAECLFSVLNILDNWKSVCHAYRGQVSVYNRNECGLWSYIYTYPLHINHCAHLFDKVSLCPRHRLYILKHTHTCLNKLSVCQ